MKPLAIITLFFFVATSVSYAQFVKINSLDKKFARGRENLDTTYHVSVSVVNCDPREIEKFSFVNLNSGTLSSAYYTIEELVFSRDKPGLATFTINVKNPPKLIEKSESIVLKFELKTSDSTIYNYDTITFAFEHKKPKWHADTTNIWRTEFNQYTDLLGFDNQRPNGLLQQELIVKFPIKFPVWGNPDKTTKYQFLRSVVFHALFNRIDKSKEFQNYPSGTAIPTQAVNADSIKPFLTTLDIFKYSNLQMGLNFNFFTLHAGNFRVNFDYEFALLRNKPYYADTIRSNNNTFTQSDVRPVYSHAHKLELYLNNKNPIGQKFDVIVNAGFMWIKLKDSYYRQFDAAEVDIFDRATTLLAASDAIDKKTRGVFFFGGTLKMKWGTNLKNSIFFRTNYYFQKGRYNRYAGPINPIDPKRFEQRKFYNHFLQLQLGLALTLNKFFGIEEN